MDAATLHGVAAQNDVIPLKLQVENRASGAKGAARV